MQNQNLRQEHCTVLCSVSSSYFGVFFFFVVFVFHLFSFVVVWASWLLVKNIIESTRSHTKWPFRFMIISSIISNFHMVSVWHPCACASNLCLYLFIDECCVYSGARCDSCCPHGNEIRLHCLPKSKSKSM